MTMKVERILARNPSMEKAHQAGGPKKEQDHAEQRQKRKTHK